MKACKPSMLYAMMASFPTEDSAREYVEELRWHGKRECPYCGQENRHYALACGDGLLREIVGGDGCHVYRHLPDRAMYTCSAHDNNSLMNN